LKAVVLSGPRRVKVINTNKPKMGSNEVLVQTKAAGICGSDLLYYLGTQSGLPKRLDGVLKYIKRLGARFVRSKQVMGHEFSGVVEEIGRAVTNIELGEKVSAWPIMPCHKCKACRSGLEHLCEHERTWPGAFCEFVKVPSYNVIKIPPELSFYEAAMLEPLACSLHAAKIAKIESQHSVAILGCGTIGLLLLQIVNTLGVHKTVITDVHEFPLAVAKTLGANRTINVTGVDCNKIEDLTGSVDITFECVGGSAQTIKQALNITRRRGKIIVLGTFTSIQSVNMLNFRRKELTLLGSNGSTKKDFSEALNLLLDRKVQVKPLITHVFPFSKASKAFETALKSKQTKSIKVEIIP